MLCDAVSCCRFVSRSGLWKPFFFFRPSRCCDEGRRLRPHTFVAVLSKCTSAEVLGSPPASAETKGLALRISWIAHWPIPSSAAISLTFTRRFSLIRSSIFPLFLSVDAVRGRTQRDWLAMSVFPSLKYLTHRVILSVPICVSICTLKCVSFRYAGFMLPKRRVFASHVLALKCDHVSETGDMISDVVW